MKTHEKELTYSGSRFELRPYIVSDPAKPFASHVRAMEWPRQPLRPGRGAGATEAVRTRRDCAVIRGNYWLMTIEHNHDLPRQHKLRAYLAQFGYEVVQNRNDDVTDKGPE